MKTLLLFFQVEVSSPSAEVDISLSTTVKNEARKEINAFGVKVGESVDKTSGKVFFIS